MTEIVETFRRDLLGENVGKNLRLIAHPDQLKRICRDFIGEIEDQLALEILDFVINLNGLHAYNAKLCTEAGFHLDLVNIIKSECLFRNSRISTRLFKKILNLLVSMLYDWVSLEDTKYLLHIFQSKQILENPDKVDDTALSLYVSMLEMLTRSSIKPVGYFDCLTEGSGIRLPDITFFSKSGYTIFAWVKLENISDEQLPFYVLRYCAPSNEGYGISAHITKNNLSINCSDSKKKKAGHSVSIPNFFEIGKWQWVVISHTHRQFRGSKVEIYSNGVLKQSTKLQYPNISLMLPIKNAVIGENLRNAQFNSISLLGQAVCGSLVIDLFNPTTFDAYMADFSLSNSNDTPLIFSYDVRNTKSNICFDISSNRLHASLFGNVQIMVTSTFKDCISQIGGPVVLFKLLVNTCDIFSIFDYSYENSVFSPSVGPKTFSKMIFLLAEILRHSSKNKYSFKKKNGVSMLSILLMHIDSEFLTIDVLSAIDRFGTAVMSDKVLSDLVYTLLLFNFRIWINAPLMIQERVFDRLESYLKDKFNGVPGESIVSLHWLIRSLSWIYYVKRDSINHYKRKQAFTPAQIASLRDRLFGLIEITLINPTTGSFSKSQLHLFVKLIFKLGNDSESNSIAHEGKKAVITLENDHIPLNDFIDLLLFLLYLITKTIKLKEDFAQCLTEFQLVEISNWIPLLSSSNIQVQVLGLRLLRGFIDVKKCLNTKVLSAAKSEFSSENGYSFLDTTDCSTLVLSVLRSDAIAGTAELISVYNELLCLLVGIELEAYPHSIDADISTLNYQMISRDCKILNRFSIPSDVLSTNIIRHNHLFEPFLDFVGKCCLSIRILAISHFAILFNNSSNSTIEQKRNLSLLLQMKLWCRKFIELGVYTEKCSGTKLSLSETIIQMKNISVELSNTGLADLTVNQLLLMIQNTAEEYNLRVNAAFTLCSFEKLNTYTFECLLNLTNLTHQMQQNNLVCSVDSIPLQLQWLIFNMVEFKSPQSLAVFLLGKTLDLIAGIACDLFQLEDNVFRLFEDSSSLISCFPAADKTPNSFPPRDHVESQILHAVLIRIDNRYLNSKNGILCRNSKEYRNIEQMCNIISSYCLGYNCPNKNEGVLKIENLDFWHRRKIIVHLERNLIEKVLKIWEGVVSLLDPEVDANFSVVRNSTVAGNTTTNSTASNFGLGSSYSVKKYPGGSMRQMFQLILRLTWIELWTITETSELRFNSVVKRLQYFIELIELNKGTGNSQPSMNSNGNFLNRTGVVTLRLGRKDPRSNLVYWILPELSRLVHESRCLNWTIGCANLAGIINSLVVNPIRSMEEFDNYLQNDGIFHEIRLEIDRWDAFYSEQLETIVEKSRVQTTQFLAEEEDIRYSCNLMIAKLFRKQYDFAQLDYHFDRNTMSDWLVHLIAKDTQSQTHLLNLLEGCLFKSFWHDQVAKTDVGDVNSSIVIKKGGSSVWHLDNYVSSGYIRQRLVPSTQYLNQSYSFDDVMWDNGKKLLGGQFEKIPVVSDHQLSKMYSEQDNEVEFESGDDECDDNDDENSEDDEEDRGSLYESEMDKLERHLGGSDFRLSSESTPSNEVIEQTPTPLSSSSYNYSSSATTTTPSTASIDDSIGTTSTKNTNLASRFSSSLLRLKRNSSATSTDDPTFSTSTFHNGTSPDLTPLNLNLSHLSLRRGSSNESSTLEHQQRQQQLELPKIPLLVSQVSIGMVKFSCLASLILPQAIVHGVLIINKSVVFFEGQTIDSTHSNNNNIQRSMVYVKDYMWNIRILKSIFRRRYHDTNNAVELYFVDGRQCMLELPSLQHVNDLYKILRSQKPPCLWRGSSLTAHNGPSMSGVNVSSMTIGLRRSTSNGANTNAPQTPSVSTKITTSKLDELGKGVISMNNNLMKKNLLLSLPADKLMKNSDWTARWMRYELSTFDYIMLLNHASGRSFQNLDNYPIFPWVLKDYSCNTFDVDNSKLYRDFRRRSLPKKHSSTTGLGSSKMTASIVLSYLCRVEPYTSILMDRKETTSPCEFFGWDNFQELFNHISSHDDYIELIPEFFYLPECLSATHQEQLEIPSVTLPNWCDSAEQFILFHRQALESDHVSAHIHNWIDYTFGFTSGDSNDHTSSPNLSSSGSYEYSNILFRKRHVRRLTREEALQSLYPLAHEVAALSSRRQIRRQDIPTQHDMGIFSLFFLADWALIYSIDENCIMSAYRYLPATPNKSFPFTIQNLAVSSSSGGGVANTSTGSAGPSFTKRKRTSILLPIKKLTIYYDFVICPSNFDGSWCVYYCNSSVFSSSHQSPGDNVTASTKEVGGDQSIRLLPVQRVVFHLRPISCIATSEDLITGDLAVAFGSNDCTISVWAISKFAATRPPAKKSNLPSTSRNNANHHVNVNHFTNSSSNNKDTVLNDSSLLPVGDLPWAILHGHESSVICMAINVDLDMVVSCSCKNRILFHSIRGGTLLHELYLSNGECSSIAIACSGNVVIHSISSCENLGTAGINSNQYHHGVSYLYLYSMNAKFITMHCIIDEVKNATELLPKILVSRCGYFLVTGSAGRYGGIDIRSIINLRVTRRIEAKPSCYLTSIALSPDERCVLGGYQDGSIVAYAMHFGLSVTEDNEAKRAKQLELEALAKANKRDLLAQHSLLESSTSKIKSNQPLCLQFKHGSNSPSLKVVDILNGHYASLKTVCKKNEMEFEKLLFQFWGSVHNNEQFEREGQSWIRLGFQRADPTTDFRAGGILSLQCLIYFARYRHTKFKQMMQLQVPGSHENTYPLGPAGINLTYMVVSLFWNSSGYINEQRGNVWHLFLQDNEAFFIFFSEAFELFDFLWHEMNAKYGVFSVIIEATKKEMDSLLQLEYRYIDDFVSLATNRRKSRSNFDFDKRDLSNSIPQLPIIERTNLSNSLLIDLDDGFGDARETSCSSVNSAILTDVFAATSTKMTSAAQRNVGAPSDAFGAFEETSYSENQSTAISDLLDNPTSASRTNMKTPNIKIEEADPDDPFACLFNSSFEK